MYCPIPPERRLCVSPTYEHVCLGSGETSETLVCVTTSLLEFTSIPHATLPFSPPPYCLLTIVTPHLRLLS